MKQIKHIIEAVLIYTLYGIFKILPVDLASLIGGAIAGAIGPLLPSNKTAYKNLNKTIPERADEHKAIVKAMWNNLGRVFAEYPHLEYIGRHRTRITKGAEHYESIAQTSSNAIFIGSHSSNWEIYSGMFLEKTNKTPNDNNKLFLTYRAPNNPYIEYLLNKSRQMNGQIQAFPKTRSSGRKILQALKDGHCLAILIDQKYNEGIAVPFLGHPAMTNPVFAQMGQRLNVPIIPTRSIRAPGYRVHFDIESAPPIATHDNSGEALPLEDIVLRSNSIISEWILEHPESWIWIHNRWGSLALQNATEEAEKAKEQEEREDNGTI